MATRVAGRRAAEGKAFTVDEKTAVSIIGDVEILDEIEQGDDAWLELRRGIPTASCFGDIMAEGERKMRTRYLHRLAGELITGELAETYRNADMDRGNAMESELRDDYLSSRFVSLNQVGFVRRRLPSGRYVGCSPDGLLDTDGVLEIKSAKPEVLIPILERGLPPPEHRAQIQGSLWITGRAWCDLYIGYRGMTPATFRFERDEPYIKTLANAVEVFDWDLHQLVRKYGRAK